MIAPNNFEYENLEHRLKLEVANHKIELAKIQGDQLGKQEHFNDDKYDPHAMVSHLDHLSDE